MLKKLILGLALPAAFSFSLLFPALAAAETTGQQEINSGLCAGANLNLNDPNCNNSVQVENSINKFIRLIINTLSIIVGVVAIIMIIVGGLRYVTSGGSDTGITSAKNTILYAVIGLVIVALAQILVRFVLRQLTNA